VKNISIGFLVGVLGAVSPGFSYAQDEVVLEEVMVTGSRIVRKDYSSSSPVATLGAETIESFGSVTVEESLNAMPQFIAGNSSATLGINGGGGATLNLRALGTVRNLVLMDQRRLPLSTAFGEVDVNNIPGVALKNVEILTGGASSVYGSEAISGVVNFQTADYFTGAKYDVEYGQSGEGDGAKTDISAMFGAESDDGRGRALIALGRSDRDSIHGKDRDWRINAVRSSFIAQGAFRQDASNPIDAANVNALFNGYGTPGSITTADRLGFNDDGTLFTQGFSNQFLNYRGPSGDDTLFAINSGGLRMPVDGRQGDLQMPMERQSVFAKAEYDLNENATIYGQYLNSEVDLVAVVSRNLSLNGPQGDRIAVPYDHRGVPTDLARLLATRADPTADFQISKRWLGLPNRDHHFDSETSQLVIGLKGDLGFRDWTYDVYAQEDSANSVTTIPNLALNSRVNDLLFSRDANGNSDGGTSICSGGYNPFGLANETSLSLDCQRYIAPGATSSFNTERSLVEGIVTGSLFELAAGDVQFSLTAGYREDSLTTTTDVSIQSNDAFGLTVTKPTSGKTETTEIGVELLVPVTEDINLTGAYRISDQDITGDADSWSLGVEWTATDSLFVRGSLQQAVRAPNAGELFSAALASQITVGEAGNGGDPCDSRNNPSAATLAICATQGGDPLALAGFQHGTTSLPLTISGNTNLEAETADTLTFGLVWQPELDKHDLSITLDYWQINIEDVIKNISGSDVLDRCYNPAQNSGLSATNEFCRLISRGGAGQVSQVRSTFLNLAALETSGIDLQVNHSIELGKGSLSTTAFFGFLTNYDVQSFPDEAFVDEAGTVNGIANRAADNSYHPELKFTLAPTYQWDDYSVGVRWRYTDAVDDLTGRNDDIDTYSLFDLSASYQLNDGMAISASISNLADKEPPEYGGEDLTRAGSYDVVGRFFSVGLKGSF